MEITKFDILQLILDHRILSEDVYGNEVVPILRIVYDTKDINVLSECYYNIYKIYEKCKS